MLLLSSLLSPASAATMAFDTWMPVPILARYLEGRIGVQAFVENAPYGHLDFVPVLNIHGEPTRWREPRRAHYSVETTATNAAEAAEEVRAFQRTWQASEHWDGCTTYRIEVFQEILEVTPVRAVDSSGRCTPYTSSLDEPPSNEPGTHGPSARSPLGSTDWIEDLRKIHEAGRPRTLREILRASLIERRNQSYVLFHSTNQEGRSSSALKAETLGTAVWGASPADYPFHPKHREALPRP